MTEIKNAAAERLARKIRQLLEQHEGLSLFEILHQKTYFKDEYVSVSGLTNDRLEKHVDKALGNS